MPIEGLEGREGIGNKAFGLERADEGLPRTRTVTAARRLLLHVSRDGAEGERLGYLRRDLPGPCDAPRQAREAD